jgi:hypothetical protein
MRSKVPVRGSAGSIGVAWMSSGVVTIKVRGPSGSAAGGGDAAGGGFAAGGADDLGTGGVGAGAFAAGGAGDEVRAAGGAEVFGWGSDDVRAAGGEEPRCAEASPGTSSQVTAIAA